MWMDLIHEAVYFYSSHGLSFLVSSLQSVHANNENDRFDLSCVFACRVNPLSLAVLRGCVIAIAVVVLSLAGVSSSWSLLVSSQISARSIIHSG
mmetsp:Transcript_6161/g.7103  ORF Transcript_6161/g.7103 Transcript_6161/m.7103 type:complete len:94 (-) Transcript_6161:35-316(-)